MNNADRIEELAAQAVDAYARDLPSVEGIVRKGRRRRSLQVAAATVTLSVIGVGVRPLASRGTWWDRPAVIVAATSESASSEPPPVPGREVGTVDPAVEARLVEAGPCPDRDAVCRRAVGAEQRSHGCRPQRAVGRCRALLGRPDACSPGGTVDGGCRRRTGPQVPERAGRGPDHRSRRSGPPAFRRRHVTGRDPATPRRTHSLPPETELVSPAWNSLSACGQTDH
jgi:hypothetical protein